MGLSYLLSKIAHRWLLWGSLLPAHRTYLFESLKPARRTHNHPCNADAKQRRRPGWFASMWLECNSNGTQAKETVLLIGGVAAIGLAAAFACVRGCLEYQ